MMCSQLAGEIHALGRTLQGAPMPLTSGELESKLWQAADILRGQIDSADYKNYIFSMLFLKRLSDRFDEEVLNAVAAGVPQAAAVSDPDEHQFAVPVPERHCPVEPDPQGYDEPGRGVEHRQSRN